MEVHVTSYSPWTSTSAPTTKFAHVIPACGTAFTFRVFSDMHTGHAAISEGSLKGHRQLHCAGRATGTQVFPLPYASITVA